MYKERIKTLVLWLLITSSVLLSGKIWFDKKLWPEGYNFFSVSADSLVGRLVVSMPRWFGEGNAVNPSAQSILRPRLYIINYPDGRVMIELGEGKSDNIKDQVNEVLRNLIKNSSSLKVENVSEEEWQNALKTRSICADYLISIETKAVAKFLGEDENIGELFHAFSKLILVPDDLGAGFLKVYVNDTARGSYQRFEIPFDKSGVSAIMNEYVSATRRNISYAFELNLDKGNQNAQITQKVVLDPYIRIPIEDVEFEIIESISPFVSEGQTLFSQNTIKNLLKQFGCDGQNMRKFTEPDDTMIFVDNGKTLRLHPNGLVEYSADDVASGLKLAEPDAVSAFALANVCVAMGESVLKSVLPFAQTGLLLNSDLTTPREGYLRFDFDYVYDRRMISVNIDKSEYTPEPLHSAVTVEIQDGKIIKYRQYIRQYEGTGQMSSQQILPALDKLYTKLAAQQTEIYIEKLDGVYLDFGAGGQISLFWQAKVRGQERVTNIAAQ